MIGSALRVEIEDCVRRMRRFSRPLPSGGDVRKKVGALVAAMKLASPGERLAYEAFFQRMAAEHGPPWVRSVLLVENEVNSALAFLGADRHSCSERVELTLDEIDATVGDPRQLPVLREDLRRVIASFEGLCEASADDCTVKDLGVSAA
jgi:hypothetical protein